MAFAETELHVRPKTRLYVALALFVAGMCAPPFAADWLELGTAAMILLYLPAFAAFWWYCRETSAHAAAAGTISAAGRAYTRRMLPLTVAYVVLLLAAIHAHDEYRPQGAALIALAALPALPILGFIWAMARFLLDETDEFQRRMMVQRMLIATAFTLVLATVWGFLELFEVVPHVPVFAAFIVWCLGLGLATAFRRPIR